MWHEARRSEKKVHDMMDAARKRAQRRAIYLAKRRGDPIQSIQAVGSRYRIFRDDGLYQATEDQQGLIPWNGKQDVMIDRFDGRALLDFVREAGLRSIRPHKKTEEEEELDEFVNFERYRDLIKHRRRGFSDEEGLLHVHQELEAKLSAPFPGARSQPAQPPANKGTYSQVGYSYAGNGKDNSLDADEDDVDDDEDDEDEEEEFDSNDSDDEGMETIAKQFGVKRYRWLVYMDKKAKEEEKRQKELIKGDPSIKKLSRKERRKVSRIERDRERETSRSVGRQIIHHDPYRESRRSPTYEAYPRSRRSRSRSRSYSPSYSRRNGRGDHFDEISKPKIEYITEFGGGSGDVGSLKFEGYSPPRSPPSQSDLLSRPSPGHILEALHVDPASGVSLEKDKMVKTAKPTVSTSTALAKLSKAGTSSSKQTQAEKKETPQERLKRIMNKQLTKQIKKDSATETAKKREQERQRLEKIAETSRLSRSRHRSRSRSYSRSPPPRRHRRSRSRSRSRSRRSRRHSSRSRSRSPSRSLSRSPKRSHKRSPSYSRSPRRRSRTRH
ncbi:CLK4-associating serine/arginine rich protein isoform X1 [Arabidopsis lyrata subsp. lyrata]|uniref:CLK4-associating serine/arginine rich protein isoform X1 n=1 Tax=Arabidopsis lyrata subsp. lyrata TaxID=81972 RepID=UPI000A29BA8C|nr:CLK4-associating serine/arginine rich protein isoform X1 [Arabidopsis lyrata subsp. lyrata]|eukprot:XP_020874495.1 CLK4-associating serine/arginine rich protein isoform X1 [Arabidopsis lyrata subsp. lyrata]